MYRAPTKQTKSPNQKKNKFVLAAKFCYIQTSGFKGHCTIQRTKGRPNDEPSGHPLANPSGNASSSLPGNPCDESIDNLAGDP